MSPRRRPRGRIHKNIVALVLTAILLAVNGPVIVSVAAGVIHNYVINTKAYKVKYGHWVTLHLQAKYKINAIHSALLYTGKVLIVAGSGNNLGNFRAGRFKSMIYNPANNTFKLIHTPSDMFCSGHTFLPDGKLLIAGGTARYEVLATAVKQAAGVLLINDQSPNGRPFKLPAGTKLESPTGLIYVTTVGVTIDPATKRTQRVGRRNVTTVTESQTPTWVHAIKKGKRADITRLTQFTILGHHPVSAKNLYGVTNTLNMTQQTFWGSHKSYIFNPATETYQRVSNLNIARWYPSLVGLKNGEVLAVSGLNEFGQMIQGQTEIFSEATKKWTLTPKLTRVFPTYPALFLMPDGNLFFSGSNAGYGSATVGRTPGIWNLTTNAFTDIRGLKDPQYTETSGSVLLPPAQAQKYMIIGGGGVGQSNKGTGRTAIVDLNDKHPHWTPGPSLPVQTRYPDVVILPDNQVLITNGSKYYRGELGSDILTCHVYNPATNKLSALASPTVGRDYHSEALLLPDGRVITLGGNPLFGNSTDSINGYFQQEIEIYSPPYLYHGVRPKITGGPRQLSRGETALFDTPNASLIEGARLIAPGAATHVTDTVQRSIELSVVREGNKISVTIPSNEGLVPSDWYMLFVTNPAGTPSTAYWVHVD
ncbi:MAG: galactose oxidase-like domain-containing protein [Solirubrobacteraceae bacterium]